MYDSYEDNPVTAPRPPCEALSSIIYPKNDFCHLEYSLASFSAIERTRWKGTPRCRQKWCDCALQVTPGWSTLHRMKHWCPGYRRNFFFNYWYDPFLVNIKCMKVGGLSGFMYCWYISMQALGLCPISSDLSHHSAWFFSPLPLLLEEREGTDCWTGEMEGWLDWWLSGTELFCSLSFSCFASSGISAYLSLPPPCFSCFASSEILACLFFTSLTFLLPLFLLCIFQHDIGKQVFSHTYFCVPLLFPPSQILLCVSLHIGVPLVYWCSLAPPASYLRPTILALLL